MKKNNAPVYSYLTADDKETLLVIAEQQSHTEASFIRMLIQREIKAHSKRVQRLGNASR